MKKFLSILLLASFPAIAEDEIITIQESPDTSVLGELSARITNLEEENRNLYGKIEELNYKFEQISKHSSSMKMKEDYYISKPGENSAEYVIKIEDKRPSPYVETPEIPFAKAAESEDEEKFEAAFAHIGKQDYAAAKKGFESFISEEPEASYLAQSHFWLGEIAQKESSPQDAALNYIKSYKADPKGRRAAESLVKLVDNLNKLGKTEEACENLARYNKEFPNQHSNLNEKAKEQSDKLKCE